MHRLARIAVLLALIAAAPLAIGRVARAEDRAAAAVSSGETAPPGAASKSASTQVSGLDVVAARKTVTEVEAVEVRGPQTCLPPRSPVDEDAPAPKLVSTYPGHGQTVRPGYAVLRLTFDLPMACRGSLPQALLSACLSQGIEVWRQSVDRRSLLITCNLKPNTHYALDINHVAPADRAVAERFQGLSGREPQDAAFSFDTSGEAPVTTAEAMIARDLPLAAMLTAARPRPGTKASVQPAADTVSTLKVEGTNRCLEPRDPPDPDVPAPKLVSTYPAQGQTVRPGLLELRFTFDLPMACRGAVAVKTGAANPCVDKEAGSQHWVQPWDRRTMRFRCRVEPGQSYVVFINTVLPGQTPWQAFQGLGGKAAAPYELAFTTSEEAPVQTEEEADAQDPQLAQVVNR